MCSVPPCQAAGADQPARLASARPAGSGCPNYIENAAHRFSEITVAGISCRHADQVLGVVAIAGQGNDLGFRCLAAGTRHKLSVLCTASEYSIVAPEKVG